MLNEQHLTFNRSKVLIFRIKEKDLKIATSNKVLVKSYCPWEGFPLPLLLPHSKEQKIHPFFYP